MQSGEMFTDDYQRLRAYLDRNAPPIARFEVRGSIPTGGAAPDIIRQDG